VFSEFLVGSIVTFSGGVAFTVGGLAVAPIGRLMSSRPGPLTTAATTAGFVMDGIGFIAVVAGGIGIAKAPGAIEP